LEYTLLGQTFEKVRNLVYAIYAKNELFEWLNETFFVDDVKAQHRWENICPEANIPKIRTHGSHM